MNVVRTWLLGLGLVVAASPALSQMAIKPAGFTTGIVQSVDPRARLLTVGAETYRVKPNTTTSIFELLPGNEVEVQYIVDKGQWVALDVRRTRQRGGILLWNWNNN